MLLIHSRHMSTPEQEAQEGRNKRTLVLMAGGAVSLILPLLGVVYIKMTENKAARTPSASVAFDHREGGESKVNVSQTVTVNAGMPAAGQSSLPVAGQAGMTPAPGSSSLDFVKGNNTYFQEKTAEAPKASTPTAPPVAAPEPAPAPKAETTKKNGKKAFNSPKLSGTKTFSNFKASSPKPTGGQGMNGVADPQAGKGGGMADMLKNVPGGIDNPDVQKLLKSKKGN